MAARQITLTVVVAPICTATPIPMRGFRSAIRPAPTRRRCFHHSPATAPRISVAPRTTTIPPA